MVFNLNIKDLSTLEYRVTFNEEKIISNSKLRFNFEPESFQSNSTDLKIDSTKSSNTMWRQVYGGKNEYKIGLMKPLYISLTMFPIILGLGLIMKG